MNLSTANFVCSFNTTDVSECECEYKKNYTVRSEEIDRSAFIISSNTPSCKNILNYEKNYNDFIHSRQTHDVDKLETETECSIKPITNERLGLSWRKQTILQRKIRFHLLHGEKVSNLKIHSYSCPLYNKRLFCTPQNPNKRHIEHQQNLKHFACSSIHKTKNQSIISKKESLMHNNGSLSNINYVTKTFLEKSSSNHVVTTDNSNRDKTTLCAKKLKLKLWRHHKHRTRFLNFIRNIAKLLMACLFFQQQNFKIFHVLFVTLLTLTQYLSPIQGLLVTKSSSVGLNLTPIGFGNASDILVYRSNGSSSANNTSSIKNRLLKNSYELEQDVLGGEDLYIPASKSLIITSSTEGGTSGGAYLDKLDNLERSLAAVLIKVAYGTTSTTRRSIPENSYVPSLTTIATPLLTTLRYQEKSHQSQLSIHHRNYELDLERDHALPTSAPNADILKSNSNPTYPNPNRHHNHERDRHRHLINSTPKPSMPNILKKTNGQMPTISMFPGGSSGDIPSYSPPARSFFTPPLPPEYQHPFADKPTLRGTNNEGGIEPSTGSYINRRPIPPPSLMPGHERIPFRPPDLGGAASSSVDGVSSSALVPSISGSTPSPIFTLTTTSTHHSETEAKKALNTPSKVSGISSDNVSNIASINAPSSSSSIFLDSNNNSHNNSNNPEVRKEVLPSIRRILSGSNGRKGDIPEVLLKQVTTRPNNYHHPPSSPVVLIDSSLLAKNEETIESADNKQNINKIKNMRDSESSDDDKQQQRSKITTQPWGESNLASTNKTSTPSAAAAIGSSSSKAKAAISAAVVTSTTASSENLDIYQFANKNNINSSSPSSSTSSISSSTSSSTLASASTHASWSLAWNIHVYLSVILFTILAVYSFYKMITYNKLTHLFSQSYFICIHLILIIICTTRTFYLCYDAYNIHSSFHIFISEILLNLPATFLTISFAVLILFLSLKSLNHKNNRYSALIRPLTVVVGCGVHVVLCITLHYVESYTLQNHQQHLYYQQQQQLLSKRQQMQQQQNLHRNQYHAANIMSLETMALSSSVASVQGANFHQHNIATSVSSLPPTPPRVLSLICQIIYIFVCFSLGLLYLYLYRILKRILRSKSQNYIHGYQNLSYAIHITIATALLFVLLASLQIFGAISISSSRPLITQKAAEIDWLKWGYQFSLRLIEIAIITLISWVTGLKTSNGSNTVNINLTNNESRVVAGQVNGGSAMFNTNLSVNPVREKHSAHHNSQYNHSNMTNFFLPCTSSSSQEQFDTDYPAVCNANTNLHTYTMRTGKLIYDDTFALNSLNANTAAPLPNDFHHPHHQTQSHLQQISKQQTQSTYQHPYDSQSLHSSAHHNVSEYGSRMNYQPENHLQYNDYLTDNTTDHYENPNFDLRGSGSATSGSALVVNSNTGTGTMQKFAKNSISNPTTTASSTNNSNMGSNSSSGSSATLQQQMLLLQGGGDTCYSEPIHENYDFNNFEKPKFKQQPHDNWPDAHIPTLLSKRDKKKSLTTLEKCGYDKPERRSSNSTHTCNSNSNSNGTAGANTASNGVLGNSGSSRYASFNTFERAPFSNVRKSDTFNNITSTGLNIMHGRNNSSSSATSATSGSGSRNTPLDIQTLSSTERHHHQHAITSRNLRSSGSSKGLGNNAVGLDVFSRSTIERSSLSHMQQKSLNQPHSNQSQAQHHHHEYSDDEEDDKDDDIMLAASPHQV